MIEEIAIKEEEINKLKIDWNSAEYYIIHKEILEKQKQSLKLIEETEELYKEAIKIYKNKLEEEN